VSPQVVVHDYEPFGAVRLLWEVDEVDELLLEGPAGTGKTRGLLEWVFSQCEDNPGVRFLFVRDTRKSLNESVLETWETEVVPPGHPILNGPTKEHRDAYQWPGVDGARIVLGGLDKPDKFMSARFDVACVFEAVETKLEAVEKLTTRLRNFRLPNGSRTGYRQQLILDTNPGPPSHWINRRFEPIGKRGKRLYSRHLDNPIYFDREGKPTHVGKAYLGRLSRLTGARYARYFLGKWQAEEGLVWECFDRAIHCVYPPEVDPATGKPDWRKWDIRAWYGAMDYGFTAPACFQVWGLDGQKRAYRVAEVYRTRRQTDWWAERITELYEEFPMHTIFVDPSEKDLIEKLNDRIGPLRGRDMPRIALGAENDVRAGIDTVAWALGNQQVLTNEAVQDPPRMFFVKDALRFGIDQELLDSGSPTCTEEEIESYAYEKVEEGKVNKDRPDPTCADHGCDATRYLAMGVWLHRMPELPAAPPPPRGSVADICGWNIKEPRAPRKWRPGRRVTR
jgi:phage terminase large subunit